VKALPQEVIAWAGVEKTVQPIEKRNMTRRSFFTELIING
jgi:hypothetical protein